jgi:hypothetical protein
MTLTEAIGTAAQLAVAAFLLHAISHQDRRHR